MTHVAQEKTEHSRYRKFTGPMGLISSLVAIVIPVYGILYFEVFSRFGINIYPGVHRAIFLGLVLVTTYLFVPPNKQAPPSRLPWYDALLALVGAAGAAYLALSYEDIFVAAVLGLTPMQMVLGTVMVLIVLEAIRRTLGWAMVVVSTAFLLYAKFAYFFPGVLNGPQLSWSRVISYAYFSDQGIFGMPLGIASTIVLSFVIFGVFLQVTGAGRHFLDLALGLMGHLRGGAAKASVVSCAFFGTMTGDPISNSGIVGPMTIPLMKKLNYSPEFAGATVAVASCGATIMPPVMGAVAFLMAEFTGAGYVRVMSAGILPAALYFLSVYTQVDFQAAKLGLHGIPRQELPSPGPVLRRGWAFFLPLLALVILLANNMSPIRAVLYSLMVLLAVASLHKEERLTLRKLLFALEQSGKSVVDTAVVCAGAGIIVAAVSATSIGLNLSGLLVNISGGSLLVLALLAGSAIYIMGMGIAPVISYILLATLVAPAMVKAGATELASHFFVFYMGVSTFITPPFAVAAFAAASIAQGNPMRTGFQAMRLGIVCYLVPFMIIFNPALLMEASWPEILWVTFTSVVGVYFLAAGVEGFWRQPIATWQRVCLLLGGFLVVVPETTTDLVGLLLLALVATTQFRRSILAKGDLSHGG